MSHASQDDPLVRMANDIGNYFRSQSREDAITGIANHIRNFWTLRMRAKLAARLGQQDSGLDELPLEAMRRLVSQKPGAGAPPPPGGDAG